MSGLNIYSAERDKGKNKNGLNLNWTFRTSDTSSPSDNNCSTHRRFRPHGVNLTAIMWKKNSIYNG